MIIHASVALALMPFTVYSSKIISKFVEYETMEGIINSANEKYIPNDVDVEKCIINGWWDLAKRIVTLSHQEGIDLSYKVRSTVEQMQRESAELIQLLNKHYNTIDVVNVAFQWAESPSEVFLAIKFSNRWSSPGALVVSDESLDVDGNVLKYSSKGTQSDKLKMYQLILELYDEVLPQETKVTPVSMGRFTITLKKVHKAVWGRLTKGNEKIHNQQIWWEMKEKHQEACDTFVEGDEADPEADADADHHDENHIYDDEDGEKDEL